MATKCVTLQASARPVLRAAPLHSRPRAAAWAGRRSQPAYPTRLRPLSAASTDEAPEVAEAPEAPAAAPADEPQAPSPGDIPNPAGFSLNFLWLEKNIAVSVDQVFGETQRTPLTEYFFWPRKDAWEELKSALESKPWVSERDKVLLLNKTTEIINFWQDEDKKHSLEEAQQKFPDCKFSGY